MRNEEGFLSKISSPCMKQRSMACPYLPKKCVTGNRIYAVLSTLKDLEDFDMCRIKNEDSTEVYRRKTMTIGTHDGR